MSVAIKRRGLVRAARLPLLPWLLLLPIVLLAAMLPVGRAAAAAVALAALAALAAAASALPSGRGALAPGIGIRALTIGVLASALLALLPGLLGAEPDRGAADPVYHTLSRLAVVFFGWGATLAALAQGSGEGDDTPPATTPRLVAAIVAGSFAWFVAAHAVYIGPYAGPADEVLYLLQSRMLGDPGFARRIDPDLAPFFTVRQMSVVNGRVFTQYPPGWPAALALFDVVGLRWWSGAILGTAAVGLTYLLGRRVRSPFVGACAAALLAASYWFVQRAATYGAHTFTTVLVLGAALLLRRGESATGTRQRVLSWMAAGLLLGGALAVRPLSGASLGVSLFGWTAIRRRMRVREMAALAGALALGALPPTLALLAFNAALTGSPWVFGYTAVNGPLVAMGFGLRGYASYDPRGCPTVVASEFTPRVALAQLAARTWELASLALPAFVLPPLVLAAGRGAWRDRRRLAVVGAFLVLPLVHVFYFHSEFRFYLELLPFLFVAVGLLLERLWRRDRAAGRAALTLGLAGAVTYSGLWLAIAAATFDGRMATFDAVRAAQRQHGRVAVFVADSTTELRGAFYSLYWFNIERFPSDAVVARDLGAANDVLLRRLPGYVPLRLVWPADGTPRLVPLTPQGGEGSLRGDERSSPSMLPPCGKDVRQPH